MDLTDEETVWNRKYYGSNFLKYKNIIVYIITTDMATLMHLLHVHVYTTSTSSSTNRNNISCFQAPHIISIKN